MPARISAIGAAAIALLAIPSLAVAANEDISFVAAGSERHAIISPPEQVKPGVRPPVVLLFPREGTTAQDALDRFGYSVHRAGAVAVALDARPCAAMASSCSSCSPQRSSGSTSAGLPRGARSRLTMRPRPKINTSTA
jgi:hypothetical protein